MNVTINLEGGNFAIVKADTLEAAELWACWEFGNGNVRYANEATEEELRWYQAWNGMIHQAEPIEAA